MIDQSKVYPLVYVDDIILIVSNVSLIDDTIT